MLISRRHHSFFGGNVTIGLTRVLAPTWVARLVDARDLVADEALTAPLGRGLADVRRSRASVVLAGRFFVRGAHGVREVRPGEVLVRPRIGEVLETAWGTTLEFDFEGPDRTFEHGKLSKAALGSLRALADSLDPRSDPCARTIRARLDDVERVLRSEGLAVSLPRSDGPSPEDQLYMRALDRALSNLSTAPALVDLESALGCDRRTVVRRNHRVHASHGLVGLGRTDFRAVRDFYRLMVASLLSSHVSATVESIAQAVGFASPQGLCHAFQRAGLVSPMALGSAARALRR